MVQSVCKQVRLYIGCSRVFRTDLAVGGDMSPPYGGGPMGGDTGLMGGDSRMIRDIILRTFILGVLRA